MPTVLSLVLVLCLTGHGEDKHWPTRNADFRVDGSTAALRLRGGDAVTVAQRQAAMARDLARGIAQWKANLPGAEVTVSAVTGGVETVSAAGPLTPAAPGRPSVDLVRDFLRSNASLYGLSEDDLTHLNFIGESVSQASGLRVVRVEQKVNGCTVFQSDTRFILDREGRLIRSVGLLVPAASAVAAPLENLVSAQRALASALSSVNLAVDPDRMTLTNPSSGGTKTEITAAHPQISGPVTSELVYFPCAPGVLVPAWSQVTMTSADAGDWFTVVDARTGELLWRKNIRVNSSTAERPGTATRRNLF